MLVYPGIGRPTPPAFLRRHEDGCRFVDVLPDYPFPSQNRRLWGAKQINYNVTSTNLIITLVLLTLPLIRFSLRCFDGSLAADLKFNIGRYLHQRRSLKRGY